MRLPALLLIAAWYSMAAAAVEPVPKAVIADPPTDAKFPARMEVIHVPSGGVQVNGVVYVASGEQPHPAFVFFHGLPGNEKNRRLDCRHRKLSRLLGQCGHFSIRAKSGRCTGNALLHPVT